MNPSGALLGFLIAVVSLTAPAESEGNPWWLWIIVFVVLAAFVGFMLWWWLRVPDEEEVAEPSRHAETPPPPPEPPAAAVDDLKRIEGIGPRIAGVLQDAGIASFEALSATSPEQLREILEAADPNLLRLADPTSWPEQAALAAKGDWSGLEHFQGQLKGGRRV